MSLQLATKIKGPVAVIGDVHGHTEKLQAVLQHVLELPDAHQRWIVFMGDFVDRGPDPQGTIELFLQLLRDHPRTTAVMGNHEFAMCAALGWLPTPEYAHWGPRWLNHYDAETTLASYGVAPGELQELKLRIPDAHRELLRNLPWLVEHPQYLFVHAGLDPNAPFDVQRRILQQKDFTLNRPQWLCSQELVHMDPPPDCPFTVVSGHVKVPTVQFRPKRVLVDTTGGAAEGDLSCVLLPEKKVISSGRREPTEAVPATGRAWWKFWG